LWRIPCPPTSWNWKKQPWFRLMLTKYHITKLSSDTNNAYFIVKFSIIYLSRLIWIKVQFVPLAYMNLSVLKFKLITKIFKSYGYSKYALSQTFFTYMRTYTFLNWWGSWTLVPEETLLEAMQTTHSNHTPNPTPITSHKNPTFIIC
jgi:hypothetical protein